MSDPVTRDLITYPVKSCRGIHHEVANVEAFGLEGDRRWMLVDDAGVMLTQRKHSRMCLIDVTQTVTGIIVSAPGKSSLEITIPAATVTRQVRVWDDTCRALDAGNEVADWFSDFLSVSCRLVYFPADEFRQVDLNYASSGDKTAFSDGFPLLLISQESLDELNRRLSRPVTMDRFRPNIVVAGAEPFAEDSWKKIKLGNISFRIVKPCSRCVIPSINTVTAEREDEVLQVLSQFRKRENKIFFGQNVIAEASGKIEVGMRVELTR